MWLKRLLKLSNYGTGSSPSGGAGGDIGGNSPFVSGLGGPSQVGALDVPSRGQLSEERRNKAKRLQRRRKKKHTENGFHQKIRNKNS